MYMGMMGHQLQDMSAVKKGTNMRSAKEAKIAIEMTTLVVLHVKL
jgi:hypothetical protein